MKNFLDLVPVDVAIWRIGHHHRMLVHTRLESLGLYRGQHRLVSILGESDGLTHSQLAEDMRISNATVSKMVQRMEHTGFVTRQPDQHDQRISRVFLTEKGKRVYEETKQMFLQLQDDETEGFTQEEIDQLISYLDRLNTNLLKHIPHQEQKKKNRTEEQL